MKKALLLMIVFVAGVQAARPAAAVPPPNDDRLQVWGGRGFLGGDVTYRIGGHMTDAGGAYDYWFPISELKWPTNIPVTTVGGRIALGDSYELNGQVMKSEQSYAGKMMDSDWTFAINSYPESLLPELRTVYSESDATAVNAMKVEGGIRYWFDSGDYFRRGPEYAIGAGFHYEEFKWNASDLDQWYPLDPSVPHDRVAGLVGTFAAIVRMPYLEVASRIRDDRKALLISLGYSPYAQVDDEDDHILRTKLSKAHTSGDAFMVSLSGRYDFFKPFFIMLQGDYLSFATAGTAEAVFYDGVNKGQSHTIDHKVTTMQYNLGLQVGLRY